MGAIIDVQLDGDRCFDLADELPAKGVPVIFATVFDIERLPERFAHISSLAKPPIQAAFDRILLKVFGQG
jgi:hypothetical protein